MAVNRFAGYRLAGREVENISDDLRVALDNLNTVNKQKASFYGMHKNVEVPGTDITVGLDVSSDQGSPFYYDKAEDSERVVMGNLEDALMLLDEHRPHVSLAWGHDGYMEGDPKQKVRIARAAERGWRDVIPKIPEGAVVHNQPVGTFEGDFERADLYMRGGFGPVQEDGAQWGFIKSGQINPLSPGVVMPEHAKHLGQRAAASGDSELAAAISKESERRLTNDTPANQKYNGYDDGYDDDYDYEYEEMMGRVQELKDDPDELIAYQLYGTTPNEKANLQDYQYAVDAEGGYPLPNRNPNAPEYQVTARGRRRRPPARRPQVFDQLLSNLPEPPAPQRSRSMEAELEFERGENNSQANLQEIENWMNATGSRGGIYRDMYGSNLDELTSGLSLNSEMSPRQASDILRSAVYQPGRYDREEVGSALLRLQDLGMVRRANSQQTWSNAPLIDMDEIPF